MDKVANSKKILSVSIASYNVEKFLDQTLESCLVPEIMDRLEVIIVNDGSKDGTADVAKKYTEKWPDTFILVDKKNGGYGSTVNVGIKTATGKYFRLLDGDDWFDKDGLREFIGILEQAQEDMVIARFRRVFESDGHTGSATRAKMFRLSREHLTNFPTRRGLQCTQLPIARRCLKKTMLQLQNTASIPIRNTICCR